MLRQIATTLAFETRGRGLVELARPVADWTAASGFATGLLTLFIRHTSASLVIQENADPAVRADLERFFDRLVPDGDALFRTRDEGDDDMPAHVRAALTATQRSIPISEAGSRSAPGRASISGNTGCARIAASWRCICSARDV